MLEREQKNREQKNRKQERNYLGFLILFSPFNIGIYENQKKISP
jgi:hypothetical protein